MMVKCPQCKGKGEYDVVSESFKNNDGTEIVYPVKCNLCNGTQKVEKAATYTGKRRVK